MFQIGDYIIYGNKGVFIIQEIGSINSVDVPKGRLYYTLRPTFTNGSTIYTPIDNQKVLIRQVVSKEDALQLIDTIDDISSNICSMDDKRRENEYKEAIRSCDCKELLKVIKTIYYRKKERIVEGKKVNAVDEKYLRSTEETLYGELSISLGIEKENVKERITKHILI